MREIVVQVPMKSYLKKYLLFKSRNRREPIKFPPKSDYNYLLSNLVSNYYKQSPGNPPKQSGVQIQLPYNKYKNIRVHNYLGIHAREGFTRQIRSDFFFDFRVFLKRAMVQGRQRKDAVLEFMELVGLTEEDMKYESLYRYSSRVLRKWRQIM